jgi:hypothetical protein
MLIMSDLLKQSEWRPNCNLLRVLWHYETLDNLLKESA